MCTTCATKYYEKKYNGGNIWEFPICRYRTHVCHDTIHDIHDKNVYKEAECQRRAGIERVKTISKKKMPRVRRAGHVIINKMVVVDQELTPLPWLCNSSR